MLILQTLEWGFSKEIGVMKIKSKKQREGRYFHIGEERKLHDCQPYVPLFIAHLR